jgi:hypothetical protein
VIIPSTYLELANTQALQFIIDTSQDVLDAASIWRTYLDIGIAQMNLTVTEVIGRDRISAAASIVDADSPAPLRSRNVVEQYNVKIPTMKEKFTLKQSDMRAIEVLRALPTLQGGNTQLVDFLIKDTQEAAVSGDKRVDLMLLQAMSTFTVDLTTTNPDGIAGGTVDLLPQAWQKQGVPTVWTDLANATPIDDIENFLIANRNNRGRSYGVIRMAYELWIIFKRTAQVKSYIQTFFNVGKANASFAVTYANVNEFMTANGWPNIEVVNYTTMYESDGKPNFTKGFNQNNVLFSPAGKMGTLANAIPMERLHQVPGKSYANYGPTLVGKWAENDPLVEYTSMEMIAFPVLNIDSLALLTTNIVQGGGFV